MFSSPLNYDAFHFPAYFIIIYQVPLGKSLVSEIYSSLSLVQTRNIQTLLPEMLHWNLCVGHVGPEYK